MFDIDEANTDVDFALTDSTSYIVTMPNPSRQLAPLILPYIILDPVLEAKF